MVAKLKSLARKLLDELDRADSEGCTIRELVGEMQRVIDEHEPVRQYDDGTGRDY